MREKKKKKKNKKKNKGASFIVKLEILGFLLGCFTDDFTDG